MSAYFLTNCRFSLGLSIYRSVSAVTQSGRWHSAGGAPCCLLRHLTVIDTVWRTPPVLGNSSAPPSDPRESHRPEAGHTFSRPLFNNKNIINITTWEKSRHTEITCSLEAINEITKKILREKTKDCKIALIDKDRYIILCLSTPMYWLYSVRGRSWLLWLYWSVFIIYYHVVEVKKKDCFIPWTKAMVTDLDGNIIDLPGMERDAYSLVMNHNLKHGWIRHRSSVWQVGKQASRYVGVWI